MPTVTYCGNCKEPTASSPYAPGYGTSTSTSAKLPWYYMNGDWMEYEPQPAEETESGPILSSFHYILDVELLAEMAGILGNVTEAAHYSALAARLWPEFNAVYLAKRAPPAPAPPPPTPGGATCAESVEVKKGGHALRLGCGANADASGDHRSGGARVQPAITGVTFASFGTPIGSCSAGFKANSSCDVAGMRGKVAAVCVGKAACTIVPTWDLYTKADPCKGIIKTLAVQVTCNGTTLTPGPPPPPPAPPAPAPLWSYATPGQASPVLPPLRAALWLRALAILPVRWPPCGPHAGAGWPPCAAACICR